MFIENRKNKMAFTLVEIMIVVAIIGLLVTLATPSFIKNRKQTQGRRIVNDIRLMDAAIGAWALETGQSDGNVVNTAGAATYLKGSQWQANDVLGHAYVIGTVGTNQIAIAPETKTALNGVGVDWGTY